MIPDIQFKTLTPVFLKRSSPPRGPRMSKTSTLSPLTTKVHKFNLRAITVYYILCIVAAVLLRFTDAVDVGRVTRCVLAPETLNQRLTLQHRWPTSGKRKHIKIKTSASSSLVLRAIR
jgi:hypothetical protein